MSMRGELRVWELEGGVGKRRGVESGSVGSVRVAGKEEGSSGSKTDASRGGQGEDKDEAEGEGEGEKKRWVGFDDEMVIVLKDSGRGMQALVVYDFT